jgi:two-component system, sensor histidine kinase YcbA
MSKLLRYFLLSILVTCFGEIYISPFSGQIRFSAGIIVLNLIIILIDDIDSSLLCFTCGVTVFIFRTLTAFIFMNQLPSQVLATNIPSLFYYIFFGIIIRLCLQSKERNSFYQVFILFAVADSVSNILETTIRKSLNHDVISFIIFVAFIRSFIAYCICFFYKREKLFILNKEHQARYTDLNLLISNIQAEMFYLRKSMKDIENVMSKSRNLYEAYKDNEELKLKTLDIAREVHEIKKDYYRVLNGFDIFINSLENNEGMAMSNIRLIITGNTDRIIKNSNKNIKFTFLNGGDFKVMPVYKLFTIINNLIVNSIEACKDGDEISVTAEEIDDNIVLKVEDTGAGVGEVEMPYIFNPGFTTKYDEITGKSSTGIGLSHVKNIVEDLGGTIDIKSKVDFGTTFTVILPKKMVNGG